MARIRDQQQTVENGFQGLPLSTERKSSDYPENPFKEQKHSYTRTAASNFDGGLLYGVNERDNWLLTKDKDDQDEVRSSQPNYMWEHS